MKKFTMLRHTQIRILILTHRLLWIAEICFTIGWIRTVLESMLSWRFRMITFAIGLIIVFPMLTLSAIVYSWWNTKRQELMHIDSYYCLDPKTIPNRNLLPQNLTVGGISLLVAAALCLLYVFLAMALKWQIDPMLFAEIAFSCIATQIVWFILAGIRVRHDYHEAAALEED